jgi:Protein of unknown function (DUF2470)/Domain of unknown function (DUF4499)
MKGGSKRDVRVPIDPPLSGYEDVKPRLLEMKALAQEGLGMVRYHLLLPRIGIVIYLLNFEQIKAPKITSFDLPTRHACISGFLCTGVLYLHFIQKLSIPPFSIPNAQQAVQFSLAFTAWFILVAHSLESLYAFSLCWKHSTGFVVGVSTSLSNFFISTFWVIKFSLIYVQTLYVLSTFACGMPIWKNLRRRIQAARIDSVMKIQ